MINQSLIRRLGDASQKNCIFVLDPHLKILTRLEMHLLPYRIWQNNLALF